MKRFFLAAILAVLGCPLWLAPAMAQSKGDACGSIRNELLYIDQKAQMQRKAMPATDYLFGGTDTMRCLVDILAEMRRVVISPTIDDQTTTQLVRVTGALRSILSTQGNGAIRSYRRFDSPDATIALAFAARSQDPSLRINATLILADVIDNTTVCVAIDHLYDPDLLKPSGGDSGRINLIGVVSVAAPWSYRENFDNITRLAAKLRRDLSGQDNVSQTREVLANLESRLKFQSTLKAPNMLQSLPADMRDCAGYQPVWANKGGARNLVY